MVDRIKKFQKTTKPDYKFTLLIPTWNNLDFLKLCVNSIRKNSFYEVQIIVIVNEGTDSTLQWVAEQNELDYVYSEENIGICFALNISRSLIKSEYIVYVNDDMYMLPDWDRELDKEISKLGTKSFMLSSTMVEPVNTGNKSVVVKNYGTGLNDFNEEQLLNDRHNLVRADWSGSSWPPNVVHVDMWDLVGGLSIEFSPGMGSDPDFAKKLYEAGVRYFKGVGTSLVYHFGSKSTGRIRKNNGRDIFMQKWGITQSAFNKKCLQRGEPFNGEVKMPALSLFERIANKMKIILSYLK